MCILCVRVKINKRSFEPFVSESCFRTLAVNWFQIFVKHQVTSLQLCQCDEPRHKHTTLSLNQISLFHSLFCCVYVTSFECWFWISFVTAKLRHEKFTSFPFYCSLSFSFFFFFFFGFFFFFFFFFFFCSSSVSFYFVFICLDRSSFVAFLLTVTVLFSLVYSRPFLFHKLVFCPRSCLPPVLQLIFRKKKEKKEEEKTCHGRRELKKRRWRNIFEK